MPRADNEKVEFDLGFVIKDVQVDEKRHTSRNAAIGRLFDVYSMAMIREGIKHVRDQLRATIESNPSDENMQIAARFEKKILSDENRDSLRGQLLVYLNEKADQLIGPDCDLNTQAIKDLVKEVVEGIKKDPEWEPLKKVFGQQWDTVFAGAQEKMNAHVDELATEIKGIKGKYPDYSVEIDVTRQALEGHPKVSSIKVTALVKNYHWSKVDVDARDLRNIRTLSPE